MTSPERVAADLKIEVHGGKVQLVCVPALSRLEMTPAFTGKLIEDLKRAKVKAEKQDAANWAKRQILNGASKGALSLAGGAE